MGVFRKNYLWEMKRFGGFFFRTAEEFCRDRHVRNNACYIRYYRHEPVDSKCILYEASGGEAFSREPYECFLRLLRNPEYAGFRHIWALKGLPRFKKEIEQYRECGNVEFVDMQSCRYLKALSSAKILIHDNALPAFFIKKQEQVCVTTGESKTVPRQTDCPQKETILFYRGTMRVNGISSALINLLKVIDYDRFDVSVMINEPEDSEKELIKRIDSRVSIVIRKGKMNRTFWDEIRRRSLNAYGRRGLGLKLCPDHLYAEEARRCTGDASFDYVIDYDGYVIDDAMMVLNIPAKSHCIWLHNDMAAEKALKYPDLDNLFSVYPLFDRIVSCSEAVMELNRRNLASANAYSKHAFCSNAIDAERILNLSLEESQYPVVTANLTSGRIHFITIGRFSPEKNHLNLIHAFRRFLDQGYDADLYILGDGPLRQRMVELIGQLGLGNHVILTGNVANPYAIMRKCDCVILPSLHEGQPIVLLEARVLHMPIVMTEFSTAKDSVIPNGQYIIKNDIEGILDGLVAYAQGQVPKDDSFDVEAYNERVYDGFLDILHTQD